MSFLRKIQTSCFLLATLALLVACSKQGSEASKNKSSRQDEALGLDGTYKVTFQPLNASVAGMSEGKAKLQVMGDTLSVNLHMKNVPAESLHMQALYNGTECPTFAHDTNDDGFIDQIEMMKISGMVLIPLDGNLNSQEEGAEEFPMASRSGSYKYDRDSSLAKMIADLSTVDNNEQDATVKLGERELSLEGKVIIVHGVSDQVYLPGSVRSFGTASERATLPVACGKIVREINHDNTSTTEPEETETAQ